MNKDINNLTDSILAFFPKFFGNPQEWEYGNGKSAEKDINKIIKLAEKVKKEIKKSDDALLFDFFIFFRNNGEQCIGMSVEQLVQEYLKNK
ncbi:MAG: hypothetical protein RBQ78_07250 [Acholeplasmataceae bacterium]|jgi:hypothetical protein|nr:hypothetical protein [Acholeplasmataceae bacterium]